LCGCRFLQADQFGLNFYREVRGAKSGTKQPRFDTFRNLGSQVTLRSVPVFKLVLLERFLEFA
jgi:hypothetical protein